MSKKRWNHVTPHRVREVQIGVSRLEREGVVKQPSLERDIQSGSHLRPLRSMDVQVDQSWQQSLIGGQAHDLMCLSDCIGCSAGRTVMDIGNDTTLVDHNGDVAEDLKVVSRWCVVGRSDDGKQWAGFVHLLIVGRRSSPWFRC